MREEEFSVSPFTEEEIWGCFNSSHSTSKHVLILYSLVVGMNAQKIMDIGIGSTTQTLRMAAEKTGGHVLSCDGDKNRFASLLSEEDDRWTLHLGPSDRFIENVEGPIDLVVHDGAHDYHQVKLDISLILPKMRTFGLICIHDTQQTDLAPDLLAAIRDATAGWKVSVTNLPFSCGLAIIRLEEGLGAPIIQGGTLPDGRPDTYPIAFPAPPAQIKLGNVDSRLGRSKRWTRRLLRRRIKGY